MRIRLGIATGSSAWKPLLALLTLACCGVWANYARAVDVAAAQTAAPAGHRLLIGDYSTHLAAIVDDQGKVAWQHQVGEIHDASLLANGNVLFQTGWTNLLEVSPEGKEVWKYDAATANGNSGKHVEVHGFQRLEDGTTMIAESGPGRIIEVDSAGAIRHEIPLHLDRHDTHRDTRQVRKLPTGNYLVCHEGDAAVREYDHDGKVVWTLPNVGKPYSAVRLKDGNTLVGCGDAHRVIEVDKDGKVVWSLEEKELPGISLAWVTMVDRLPNGNTWVVNCHAGPDNPQIVEVTPDKKVVWTFKDFKRFGNALPVARLLDAAK